MKFIATLLLIVLPCLGDGVMLQLNMDNLYPTHYAKGISNTVELQGLEISLGYLYKNKFLFGFGLGPMFMNGNLLGKKEYSALLDMDYGKYFNFFYIIPIPKAYSWVGLGGKFGYIPASYRFETWEGDQLIPYYSVKEEYYAAIGPKLMVGFKYLRAYFGSFLNFGKHTEIIEQPYYYWNSSGTNEKVSRFASSFQLEFGLEIYIGH